MAGFAITKPNPKKMGTIAAINESRRVKENLKFKFSF